MGVEKFHPCEGFIVKVSANGPIAWVQQSVGSVSSDVAFNGLLADLGVRLTAASLVYAGRWLTPPLGPLRFDNRFFLLAWHSLEAAANNFRQIGGGKQDHGNLCAQQLIDRYAIGKKQR